VPLYCARVVDGLAELAVEDLRERLPRLRVLETLTGLDGGRALIVFRHDTFPADLPALPLLDDLGVQITNTADIVSGWSGLRTAREAVGAARELDAAVALAASLRPGRTRRASFHAAAFLTGDHAFLRSDLQHAVVQGVADHFPQWRPVAEGAHFVFQADLIGARLLVSLRVSDPPARGGLTVVPAGTPRPSVAAALVRLTRPHDGDVFLDPICGGGALLIARGAWGRYRKLLGGDPDERAIEAARTNIGPRYKPIAIETWEPTSLPLDEGAATRLATHLPTDEGTSEQRRARLTGLLTEWSRVLAPDSQLALLAHDRRALDGALSQAPTLMVERRLSLTLRNHPAVIVALRRGARA
jgi:SAM-dependent methyltransferase